MRKKRPAANPSLSRGPSTWSKLLVLRWADLAHVFVFLKLHMQRILGSVIWIPNDVDIKQGLC